MSWFPKLVGGVTVRERPPRYPNEPKYRRLDFIRPKSPGHDEDAEGWPIVYSSEPVRGVQLWQPPIPYHFLQQQQQQQRFGPQAGPAFHPHHQGGWHPHFGGGGGGGPGGGGGGGGGGGWSHPAVQGRYPPNHPIHRVPAPPLSGHQPRPMIEGRRYDDDDDDEIVQVVSGHGRGGKYNSRGGSKGKKGKSKSKAKVKNKKVPHGHHVFFEESSSDSDSEYEPIGRYNHHGGHR